VLSASLPDVFEINDSREIATDLSTISGTRTVSALTIHTTSDRDFYRFTTTGTGTSAHYVDVLFAHANGDVDVRLLDSAGATLESSTGVSDDERLSLQDRPAGTYFVEVYGFAGARNAYSLAFETPATPSGDRFEANESRETATDLRTISGAMSVAELSIHTTSDRDFYRFTTTGTGTSAHYVDVLFAHANGDVDVRLLDSAGATLESSTGVSDDERLSLQDRPAGTYFVEVYGFAGARNAYSLAFETPATPSGDRFEANESRETATDLRVVSGSLTLRDLTITAGDRDFYRFELSAAGSTTHAIQASFVHAGGDINLRLLDAQGSALRSSLGTADNERIAFDGLSAGTYFVEVFGASASVANGYRLDFATPVAQQPGGPATDAWTIMVYMTASDLQQFAFSDVNEIEKALSRLPGTVNVSVFWDQSSARTTYPTGGGTQPAWGTAGRAFMTPDTNMSSVATNFEILSEANTGSPQTLVDFVNWSVTNAPAQRYGLILWDHGAGLEGFNFDDSDSGQTRDNLTTPEFVQALTTLRGAGTSIDLVAFDACLMAMTEVGYATRDLTTAYVASQEVVGGDGHDYTTLFRLLESDPYAVAPLALATGFVRSFGDQYLGTGTADTHSAVNSARYAGVVSALASFTSAAGGASSAERTAMASARSATPSYTYSYLRDLGGFMQRIATNSAIGQAIRTAATGVVNAVAQAVVSKTSDQRSSSGMSIYLPTLGSTIPSWYTSQYAAFDAATGWTGFLRGVTSAGRSVQTDWAGSTNNLSARSFDIGTVAGSGLTFDFLSLEGQADVDWFRFSLAEAGGPTNRIVAGDRIGTARVSLQVYDAGGTTLIRELVNGADGLSLSGLPAGQYALRVSGDDAVERYALTFDAPGVGAGLVVPNSTPDKAVQWGLVSSARLFTGFLQTSTPGSGAAAEGWSYFDFDTAPLVGLQNFTLVVSTAASISIDVELLDQSGTPIQSRSGAGAVSLPLAPTGSAESYGLRVRQSPARSGGTAAAFNVRVGDLTATVAQSPTGITLSGSTVPENQPPGTAVGTLSTTDPDVGDTFAYELVPGEGSADNASFTINGAVLETATRFNFDTRSSYSVRVRSTDQSGLSTEKAFTITVADVADEPLVVEGVAPPAPGAYRAGQRVTFVVTLSEAVQVRGRPQIQVRAGTVTRTATYLSGSGTPALTFQYTVGARDNASAVTLGQRFVLSSRNSITAGAESLPANLPAGIAGAPAPGVRLDAAAPNLVGRVGVPGSGTYRIGQSLDFVVRFSEAVIVNGTPQIGLTGLTAARQATYLSGSGTQSLTFRYVVQAGDALGRNKSLGLAKSISLPAGASIADEAGNRAAVRISAPSLRGIRIDTATATALSAGGDVAFGTRRARAAAFATLG